MLNYTNKTKLIIFGILTILIVFVIWLVNFEQSKSEDILMMSQSQGLANALENYYNNFRVYPEALAVDLGTIQSFSEQGFNTVGQDNYWQLDEAWLRAGTYQSDGSKYTIQFTLNHGWQALGLKNGGGLCQITSGVVWQCASQ